MLIILLFGILGADESPLLTFVLTSPLSNNRDWALFLGVLSRQAFCKSTLRHTRLRVFLSRDTSLV